MSPHPEAGGSPARRTLSPRKRAQRIRWVQYAVLIAALSGLAAVADWGQIGRTFFDPELIRGTLSSGLGTALRNTVLYAVGAFVVGVILGTTLALMRLSQVAPYRWIAAAWVEFFRGLPALLVLLALGLLPVAFPGLVIPFDVYGIVWLGLGIVSSAYIAETVRAGIQAVPRGQIEAARSLGMPPGACTRKIVLPQAARIVTPPMTNEFILLVKDSSLVYVIGLGTTAFDLTKYGRELSNTTANLTPIVIAGFCYLLITLPLSWLVRRLELRQSKGR